MANFDVFLSHNSKDKPVVREIAAALHSRGITPGVDEDILLPGDRWQEKIEKIIRACGSAAVLFGPSGIGPWQEPEMRGCFEELVRRKLRVIPVLLPGAPRKPRLPLFFKGLTWLDLRDGLDDSLLDLFVRAIRNDQQKQTRTKPAPKKTPQPQAGPTLHNLPFPPLRDLFKGRDTDLHRLESTLDQPGRTAAITQSEAISGLGGIGKTRLAVEHAWRCGHRYTAVFFVRADSPAALRRGLASLAGPALLSLPERTAPMEEEVVAAVLRWLREHPGWLLILDNVDTEEAADAVGALLPSLSGGRVLITSRLSEWPPDILTEPLDTIPREEAVRFLLQRTKKDDPEPAGRLAAVLGDLPLALEQAAAYILHTRMSFADYLGAWQRERQQVLGWHSPRLMKYPASVTVTWQTTFEQLGPTSAALLRLTAFLAPDPIPVAMFAEGSGTVEEAAALFCEETGRQPAPCPVREALAELAAYSMVTLQDNGTFAVHRMVQEVLRSHIPADRLRGWIELTLRIVNDSAPEDPDDVRTWPIWNPLRPHVAQIVAQADEAGIAEPTSRLMNDLGFLLKSKALYHEAEPLYRRALGLDEQAFGTQHPNVARVLNNLAQLLQDTNRHSEAEPLMRRALDIDEQFFGTEHPDVAGDLNNLAGLLQDTNRYSEAEPLMRHALALDEQAFGTDHPKVAIRLHNLAGLLQETNRHSEAEPLMRRALAVDEQAFGTEHPNVARVLNNLAQLLQDTNRHSEAEPLMRRALDIDEQSFGSEHPDVAIASTTWLGCSRTRTVIRKPSR